MGDTKDEYEPDFWGAERRDLNIMSTLGHSYFLGYQASFNGQSELFPKKIVVFYYFPSILYSLPILRTNCSPSITVTRGNTTKLHDKRSNILHETVSLDDILRHNANRISH